MKKPTFLFLFFSFLSLLSCRREQPVPLPEALKNLVTDSAMVVSPHPITSQIGKEILQRGGNAIDAAVAVQFAMAVAFPRAGNLGGGGFMVIRLADGATTTLDYREQAPALASRNMYLDSLGQVIEGLSRSGHLAAGVPGTVDGMATVHERYGTLPWEEVIAPAIELARKGYLLSESEINRLNTFQEDFRKYNKSETCPFIRDQWKAGDALLQPDLAATLERVRDQGRAGFYEGPTADLIVREMESGGGLITHADLKHYRSQWREPITGLYRGYRIISMPPASSGGIALVQLLKMVEPYPLSEWGFQSAAAVHVMVEAERRAYADRTEYLGDSDYYQVPIDSLLSETYLAARMADYSADSATTSDHILAGQFMLDKESFETTHTSVVDAQGNAVSVTTTLNSNFGCKVMVDGAGFFLNNEMDDFSVKPGVPNQFGLIGAEANAIHPGKRMLSSMTPTIVEKDGRVFLVLGAPGGSTIITAVFQVIVNVIDFGMDLEAAVSAGRFHHQWLPDEIRVEATAIDTAARRELRAMGHHFKDVSYMAVVKAIQVLPDGKLQGVGDPRNPDDTAAGY